MRKVEFKKMYQKLMDYIGKKILYFNQIEEWTDVEIASKCKIAAPRLSEIKNYKKDGRIMSENTLISLIDGGIVTIEELKEKIELNETEEEYIESLSLAGDKPLRTKILKAKKAGIDIEALIDKALQEKNK